MDTVKLKQYFNFSEGDSETPLYLLLRRGIEALIADLEDGAPFPSERELSEFLNVNRRTLRKALEPLLRDGKLKRKKHETFVRKNHGACCGALCDRELHPFTEFALSQKRRIRILLYEMLPFQQDFWSRTIDDFNRISPVAEVEAYYPQGAPAQKFGLVKSYWDEFFKGDFDLAHVPVSYACPDRMRELCRPVDRALIERECGEEFLSGTIASSIPGLLEKRIPFAFNFGLNNWNRKYFALLECDKTASFEAKLAAAVRKLPEEVRFMPGYYDLCRDLGLLTEYSPEKIQAQCRIILKRLDILRGRKNLFQKLLHQPLVVLNDEPGEFLFCPLFSMSCGIPGAGLAHDYFPEVIEPREDSKYWGGFQSLVIHRDTEHYQSVRLFVDYMLSEPVQRRIWKMIHMAPVLWNALDTLDFAPPEKIAGYLEHCRDNPKEHLPPVGVVMLPYFEDYLGGRISGEKILANVLEFFK